MKQTATVVEDSGDFAVIKVERSSMCDGCHKKGCDGGCSIYSVFGGDKSFTAEALNRAGAKKGDTVVVETSDKNVYLSSFLVFILPLILGFVTYSLINGFFGEHIAVLCAVGVFAVYFVVLSLFEKLGKKSSSSKLVIVSIENKDA